MNRLVIIGILAALLPGVGEAKSYRDPEVRRAFMKIHPCPSTGKTRGKCPGFQVDHRWPRCYYDGPDEIWNMQWLSIEAHREKTKLDVKVCNWDGK